MVSVEHSRPRITSQTNLVILNLICPQFERFLKTGKISGLPVKKIVRCSALGDNRANQNTGSKYTALSVHFPLQTASN